MQYLPGADAYQHIHRPGAGLKRKLHEKSPCSRWKSTTSRKNLRNGLWEAETKCFLDAAFRADAAVGQYCPAD